MKIDLDDIQLSAKQRGTDLLALDQGLQELSQLDPQQARVVEMRFFAGLSIEETAEALDISVTTAKREWAAARAWLYRSISGRTTRA